MIRKLVHRLWYCSPFEQRGGALYNSEIWFRLDACLETRQKIVPLYPYGVILLAVVPIASSLVRQGFKHGQVDPVISRTRLKPGGAQYLVVAHTPYAVGITMPQCANVRVSACRFCRSAMEELGQTGTVGRQVGYMHERGGSATSSTE